MVDITNYVMLEYGQPLHAFDLDQVRDAKVIVRPAGDGERFTSLDGQEHELRSPMLMIADPERSIGLAGVMGGANSEMTDATRNVLLESATFNAINTRRTSNALKLRTDASLRFEKGLNPELAMRAVRRATRLILETAGGEAAQGVYDVFPGRSDPPHIPFSHDSLRRVLGVDFPTGQVTGVLSSLGFTVERGRDGAMTVVPPYWRTDVGIEEDVVEEVARVIGYDAVEGEPLGGRVPEAIRQPERELREELRDAFVSFGLQEAIFHTLVSGEDAALPDDTAPLGTVNPMSQEQAYLRTSLRPALLRGAMSAMRQQGGAAMFEVGRVFIPRDGDLPDEREIAAVVLVGPRGSLLWEQDAGPFGFFDAKGVVESALARLGLSAAFERTTDPLLHPGRTAAVLVNGEQVGTLGELRPQAVARYDFPVSQAALIELDMQLLAPHVPAMRSSFSAFSRYPSAVRDLALVLDASIPARRAQEIIEGGPLVARATIFDLFEGDPLPHGKKSLAFTVEFQSPLKTLETAEVNDAVAAIVAQLERETGAALRA